MYLKSTLLLLVLIILNSCSSTKTNNIIVVNAKKRDFKTYKTKGLLVGATLNHYELKTEKEDKFLENLLIKTN